MCLYPRFVKNPKYKENQKNGGNIPAVRDPRILLVPIGCQECLECKKQKANGWRVRLMEDIQEHRNGVFVTLTLSNESYTQLWQKIPAEVQGYDRDNAIITLATRRFLERWRKKNKKSVRHWLVSELGGNGTENIHLHGIIWTDKPEDIRAIWHYGFVWDGIRKNGKKTNYVNSRTVNYVVKYVHKMDFQHRLYKPVILCSAGIGNRYTKTFNATRNKFNEDETREYYLTDKGFKCSLPIYYRNKLYTDDEREKLWIHRLNKNVRFVLGQKIDVSNNHDEFFRTVIEARKKNKLLGYGDGYKDIDKVAYEQQIRMLKQMERLHNNNNNKKKKK